MTVYEFYGETENNQEVQTKQSRETALFFWGRLAQMNNNELKTLGACSDSLQLLACLLFKRDIVRQVKEGDRVLCTCDRS